ncbi:hypothetical protein GCM10010232_50190 [Streptomyces amakusaensis]|uniref:Uncharacterized protein n=1 Tax=Streptomyces amakusaensis TaxID=67271 RepID=A0ABW0AJY8_9ACTN
MGNRADECGSDVEIYRRALSSTIHADTRTGAPEELLRLLDRAGLERHTVETAGPVYTWHEAPGHLTEDEQKRVVTSAVPVLLLARYIVNITDDVFAPAAYQDAVAEIRGHRHPHHNATTAAPAPPPGPVRPRGRTP